MKIYEMKCFCRSPRVYSMMALNPMEDDDGWGEPDPTYWEKKERQQAEKERSVLQLSFIYLNWSSFDIICIFRMRNFYKTGVYRQPQHPFVFFSSRIMFREVFRKWFVIVVFILHLIGRYSDRPVVWLHKERVDRWPRDFRLLKWSLKQIGKQLNRKWDGGMLLLSICNLFA